MTKAILGFVASLLLAVSAPAETCPTMAIPSPLLQFSGTNCSSRNNPAGDCALDLPVTFTLVISPGVPYVMQSCETSVKWEFGDGTTETTSGVTVTHAFHAADSFFVHGMVMAGSTYINHDASYVDVANGVAYIPDSPVTVRENAGPAVVRVRTTFAPTTVDYYTWDYGGNVRTRYVPVHGTLSFAAGEYEKTVSIPIIDDNAFNGDTFFDTTFAFELSKPTNGVVLAEYSFSIWHAPPYFQRVAVTIVDDDSPAMFDFGGTFPTDVPENAGTFNPSVVRSGDLTRSVSLTWTSGSATGTLTFNPNETQKSIVIPIPHDNVWEPPRARVVTISAPTNGGIIAGPSPGSKTVQWNVVDDLPAPVVTIGNASMTEGDSGSQQMNLPISLSVPLAGRLAILLATRNGTAIAGADYAAVAQTLTFEPGETAKSVAVAIYGDTLAGPDRTFTLTGTVTNTDYTKYITVANGSGTIINDDMAPIKIASGATGRMSVVLANAVPLAAAVTLTSSDATVAVPASFTLAPGVTTQSFDVTGIAPGHAMMIARLPASAGGTTFTGMVTVYAPATLTATPDSVALGVGRLATIALTFSPSPASPLALFVHASNANVQVPTTVSIDTSGHGRLAIDGVGPGDAFVYVTQPDANGSAETPIAVRIADASSTMFVTSVDPATGPISGGTHVTLSGQNFSPACLVSFGGASATSVTFSNPMSLTATSPAHVAGTVDVTVICGSQESTVGDSFRYLPLTRRRSASH